jgi:molecular chaperone GrpE (heat shock protein)
LCGIGAELAGLHEQSRFLNQILDRLHAENERLRRAESQKSLPPVVREMIKLADDWRSRGAVLRSRTEPSGAEPAQLCDEIVEDISMILDRQGIEEFRPEPGATFDRHEHRAVGTRGTHDRTLDGTVAEMRRPGYRVDGRVMRFAEVVVFKSTCPGSGADSGPGDPPGQEEDDDQHGERHRGQQ